MFSALFVALILKAIFRQTKFWKLWAGSFVLLLTLNIAVLIERETQTKQVDSRVCVELTDGSVECNK